MVKNYSLVIDEPSRFDRKDAHSLLDYWQ